MRNEDHAFYVFKFNLILSSLFYIERILLVLQC